MDQDEMRLCAGCGTVAKPASHTPGSMLIELALWLCIVVPGLVYSLWRLSARHKVCPACGNRQLMPLDAPLAQQFMVRNDMQHLVPPPRPPSSAAYAVGRGLARLVKRQ